MPTETKTYTYTIGGKNAAKQNLVLSNNWAVVRTKNARPLSDAVNSDLGKEALGIFDLDTDKIIEFPEADVTILKLRKDIPVESDFRDRARNVLKKEEEVRFAGRVLLDPDSEAPVIYTENIFIKFFDNINTDVCERILTTNKLRIKQKLEFAKNSYFVTPFKVPGLQVFEISQTLLSLPEVELCHPELIRKRDHKVINVNQWHLKDSNINGEDIKANVKADKAHDISKGDQIVIAVIDDGIDIDHPEFNLPGKVVFSRDIMFNSNDPRPKYDNENHGTACAGVAAASGVGSSGVAPNAKIMPIRLVPNLGSIEEANAFKWAADNGAHIISCSWGPVDGRWFDNADPAHTQMVLLPDSTRLALDYAVNNGRGGKGCVIFFAAGNGNEDVKFDGYASYKYVTAVAACNDTNKRSVYSDFGDSVWCCFPSSDFGFEPENHPDPLTHGIYTTDRTGEKGYDAGGDYTESFGGTSSACPGAAGIAALILSVNPSLTWQEVRNIIRESCEKIDTAAGQYNEAGHSKYYGYGMPDAEKALKKAQEFGRTVKIISALINPEGWNRGNEKITLQNTSSNLIDLNKWTIEVKLKRQAITGSLSSGEAKTISLDAGKIMLSNKGATIKLFDPNNHEICSVSYNKKDVEKGVVLIFP